MAMNDCEKCWDTPCTCGWDYRNIPPEKFVEFLADILRYRSKTEAKQILLSAIKAVDKHPNWSDKE